MKLFHIKSGKLVELKESKEGTKYFEYEKVIQNLIESNLDEIFNGFEFIQSEYQIDDLRPDTIAFDTESKSFVIIEYKNVLNKSVVDQGISYYQLLQDKKEAFVLLYHKVKDKLYDVKEINWDETRVIFVSPYFTIHQLRASGFVGLPIELYEIRKYDEVITLNKIEAKSNNVTSVKSKSKIKTTVSITEYSEAGYLEGKYGTTGASEKSKQLYFLLKNSILEYFDVEFKQKSRYAGFYSTQDGSSICSVLVDKTKLMLVYSTTKKKLLPENNFIEDVSEKGHWGVGHFRSTIHNREDVTQALKYIEIVYEDKTGKRASPIISTSGSVTPTNMY